MPNHTAHPTTETYSSLVEQLQTERDKLARTKQNLAGYKCCEDRDEVIDGLESNIEYLAARVRALSAHRNACRRS